MKVPKMIWYVLLCILYFCLGGCCIQNLSTQAKIVDLLLNTDPGNVAFLVKHRYGGNKLTRALKVQVSVEPLPTMCKIQGSSHSTVWTGDLYSFLHYIKYDCVPISE